MTRQRGKPTDRNRNRTPGRLTTAELTIERLGARGHGIAHHAGSVVYVPFTVPGDRVRVTLGAARGDGRVATTAELLTAGPDRATPACRHFGMCGGCAWQHLDGALYDATKLGLVREALAHHGLADAPVAPLRRLPPGTRRRVRFSLSHPARRGATPLVGFAERSSHRLVDLAECAVLDPRLVALVKPLRGLAATILRPGEDGHATLQRAASGIDLLLDLPATPGLEDLERLADFAETQDLARLAWRAADSLTPVPLAQRRPIQVMLGGIIVDVPAESFLQATPEAETALSEAVLTAVGNAATIADLFAGLGTFTFALARHARIHAVEGAAEALAALAAAARRAGLAGRITTEHRDLQARPMLPDELARFDAVVFDPPRIGAAPQAAALARSTVPAVVAVSCNPASFARDAATLVAGGYRLRGVQPIDQFVWSPHIELVAAFSRG